MLTAFPFIVKYNFGGNQTMELNLVKTTYEGLSSNARCVLALRNKPFFFARMKDTLCMNKNMKGIRKITAALETMWKYDEVTTDEIMEEIDEAYNTIEQAAGGEAAYQAWDIWCAMAKESRIARAKADALEWIVAVYDKLDDPDWDEMHAAGYSSDFVDEGLWRAFSQLNDDHPDSQRYRNWSTNATKAAFVYGFQMGVKRKTAEA